MKHWTTIAALCCLTLLLATGCRSTEKVTTTAPPADTTTTQPGEVMPPAPVVKPKPEFTTITFSGEADGISFNGQLRMAKDSVIWCNVSKIFDVGRAMATPDSVWLRAPLLGRNESGDYSMVKKKTGVDISFAELQAILESDDAEQRIAKLARRLGYNATIKIKKREKVDSLTFPFKK